MRLYLAVAVLMLAFVAYTEAQDDTSFTDKFDRFGQKLTEIGQSLAEKTKNAFDDIHNSEFGTSTRNWFSDAFEKMKAKFGEMSQ
ncbi:apolipoprotein C-I [Astatotilapia calliptera]|uniref:apolipoprotein C-I n=1 Tax=Astatotilapia calliptera TaxID=8154 RepID=UPI000E41BFA8|nr:apolipoprotein C-I-like [Astatotilapia calliptera]